MSSAVAICNLALIRVSGNSIISLTDNTVEGRLCNALFDVLVEEVSMEGEWTSTIKRATLNATTTIPNNEWSKEYQLPTDPLSLKVIEINELRPGSIPFDIEGDKLLTDATEVRIKYIAKITNPQELNVPFRTALISRIAVELLRPITGASQPEKDRAFASYKQVELVDALASDGQQGSVEKVITSALHDVR